MEVTGIKAGEFNKERGTIGASVPVSVLRWMVAIPTPTPGVDNEEGSGKEEVSCVF